VRYSLRKVAAGSGSQYARRCQYCSQQPHCTQEDWRDREREPIGAAHAMHSGDAA